ncbi:MAG: TfoX/Sxy family protein [Pseudomonadota bacterium]
MAVSEADIAFVTDLFNEAGTITTRKMMGGLSIYCEGEIFSIMTSDGHVMLKAQGPLAAELESLGSSKFTYTRKNGTTTSMCYWDLPDAALDDPETAVDWARRSLKDTAEYKG